MGGIVQQFGARFEEIEEIRQSFGVPPTGRSLFIWKGEVIRLILILVFTMQALLYSPLNASTLTCMGLVHSLCGNISDAVETLHKSLGIRRNDSFTTTLLNSVIELLVEQEEPFEGKSTR